MNSVQQERLDVVRHWFEDGDSMWELIGGATSVEDAVEMCRLDATRRRRWGQYRAVRPDDVMRPVEVVIRQLRGEFQALIVRDPRNPRMTDEAIMARFEAVEVA